MDPDTSAVVRPIAEAVVLGVGATGLLDLWNLFLRRAFGIPSLDNALLGRWLLSMRDGVFRHARIAASPAQPAERTVGWLAHYAIGAGLAIGFVAIVSVDWLARPRLLPALVYGVATIVFPFFVLQPSFGLGIASSRTPRPAQARLKSLATHVVFGVGLYLCALGLNATVGSP